ncbi:hypothetical protein GBA52_011192 [Prunus armeniaca]|nr:hypothetical protein GBA52_011192 [Prunus armeniaca]
MAVSKAMTVLSLSSLLSIEWKVTRMQFGHVVEFLFVNLNILIRHIDIMNLNAIKRGLIPLLDGRLVALALDGLRLYCMLGDIFIVLSCNQEEEALLPKLENFVHFWAPTFKWGLTIANILDSSKPPEDLSYAQQSVHFWAPTFKWGVSIANIIDSSKPPEQLSYVQQSGMTYLPNTNKLLQKHNEEHHFINLL